MKAMLLAAGLGKRLRPVTDSLPKPLLPIAGTTLIDRHLSRLAGAGYSEVVINVHYLAEQIVQHVGSGSHYGLTVHYSREPELLETGGGIRRALDLLGNAPFTVISADVYIDYPLENLPTALPGHCLGHLIMVPNPAHHRQGDFAIDSKGYLVHEGDCRTFASVMVMRPELVSGETDDHFMLRRVFDRAISERRLMGSLYQGYWCDVGTPQRYEDLRRHVREISAGSR